MERTAAVLSPSGEASGHLVSVNVGLPRAVSWRGQTVSTAIWKSAVQGRAMVRHLNVDGDRQGDLVGHGGEHRAVFVYQLASYAYWAEQLNRHDFVMGQFGENFTVDGLSDDEVCIGDRYRIGDALFEVTQPRVTCYRIGMRMEEPRMAALLVERGKPGFYLRVLSEGEVVAGDSIELVSRVDGSMTVSAVSALLYLPPHAKADIERAAHLAALSPGWRSSFEAMLQKPDGQSGNPGLAPPSRAPVAWSGFRSVRITTVTHEADDVVVLGLESVDGTDLAEPLPGQYLVVRLQRTPQMLPEMRSFSLCGLPDAKRYRLGIKREAGGTVSTYLADRARPGETIDISAPRGSFVLSAGDGPVTLVSAGIGVTPVLAMLHALVRQNSRREVWWLHGARNRAAHPFAAEARALLTALPRGHAHVCYSRPDSKDAIGRDFDSAGHIDAELIETLGVSLDSDFYVCGPNAFLADLRTGMTQRGLPAERFHTEVFGSTPTVASGIVGATLRAPHQPAESSRTGPSIGFSRSNLTVNWGDRYQSILELAEACDVPARWSCRTGVCHSCESGLISGTVSYDPEPLDAPARGNVLLCCARPNEDVILDL